MASKKVKSIAYAIGGHIYEHYESTLFALFGPLIAPYFFPDDPAISNMGIFMAIFAGFVMRPLGAVIFSWIGDKYGRKKGIVYSFMCSILPAIIIAVLPGYEAIGYYSPFILIVCRLFQGASIGGAFYGTITFVGESSPQRKKNLNTGLLLSMGFLGALLGTMISAISDATLPPWGWRVPFLFGAIYGVILYFTRGYMQESEAWKRAKKSNTDTIPILQAAKLFPRNIIAVFLFGSALLVPFYISTSWMARFMQATFELDNTSILIISSLISLVSGLGMILFCWLTTFFKNKKLIYWSLILNVIMCVIFYFATARESLPLIIVCQFLVAILTAFHGAPVFVMIQKMFPPRFKYSGFAVPFSIGQAIFTGLTPGAAEKIVQITGSPTNIIYILVASLICIICATFVAETDPTY